MPPRRKQSKGLPAGLRRIKGRPYLYALRYDPEAHRERLASIDKKRDERKLPPLTEGERAKLKPFYLRSTDTRDVKLASEVRDRWREEMVRVENGLETASSRTVRQFIELFIRSRERRSHPACKEHIDALRRHLVEFVDRANVTSVRQITPTVVSETLGDIRNRPRQRMKPGGVTARRIARERERALAEGREAPPEPQRRLSASSRNARLRTLKSFFNWLVNTNVIDKSPIRVVERDPVVAVRRTGALTSGEILRLIEGAPGLPDRFHHTGAERQAIYALAIGTSLRQREIRSLRVRHLHLNGENPVVEMAHAKVAEQEGTRRPIARKAAAMVASLVRDRGPDELVFPKLKKDFAADMLRADLMALGIPLSDENGVRAFKSLRATVATELIEAGFSMEVARVVLGHKSQKTTERHYAKSLEANRARAVDEVWESRSNRAALEMNPKAPQGSPSGTSGDGGRCEGVSSEAQSAAADAPQEAPKNPLEPQSHQRDLNPQPPDYKAGTLDRPPDHKSGTSKDSEEQHAEGAPMALRSAPAIALDELERSVDAVHAHAVGVARDLGDQAIGGGE